MRVAPSRRASDAASATSTAPMPWRWCARVDEQVLQLADRSGTERRREPHDGAVRGDRHPGVPGEHLGVGQHERLGVRQQGGCVTGVRQRRPPEEVAQHRQVVGDGGADVHGWTGQPEPPPRVPKTMSSQLGTLGRPLRVGAERVGASSGASSVGASPRVGRPARARASHPRGRRRRSAPRGGPRPGCARARPAAGEPATRRRRGPRSAARRRGAGRRPGCPRGTAGGAGDRGVECSRIAAIRSIGSCGARWCTAWSTPPSASMS